MSLFSENNKAGQLASRGLVLAFSLMFMCLAVSVLLLKQPGFGFNSCFSVKVESMQRENRFAFL